MKVFELKVLLFSTWIWTTTFAQIYQRDLSLECRADGHQVLSEQSRKVSSLNSPRVSHETLCDTALYPRWYRFSLDGNNAEIASKCLTANQCGTSTPIWLRAKKNDSVISYDDRPSLPGKHQSKVIIACVAIQSDCCAHSILINVKNCGDFFIYFLWIPPEVKASVKCPAFCAESKVSVAKTTRDSHVKRSPFIKPRVISTDLRVEGAFRLRCIFEDPVGRGRALYRITWTSSKTGNTKVLHTEDTINTYSEADVINTDVNIACAVKVVDRVNPKNILLEESKSENFYVGLKMEPSEINLKEGEKQSVTVTSSVPFICDSNGDDSCSMRVFFKSRNSDRTNNLPTNVMLDECSVAIFREACNEEGCGRGVFEISGVEDFANDGNRRTTIEIRPILNNDVVWTGYNAGSVEVTVTDVPTSQCYSYTDPHILTLDGALYDLHTTGTFVFYRSTERNFEVHARVWDRCDVGNTTTDSTPAWCHCGVAVQENGDVIVIDRCERDTSSTYDVTEPDIEIISELPLAQGTTILKSHNGKKITVFFPSGAFVRVDVETWGLGLTIQAPTIDREKTTGLCGNFDGNQENDPNKKEIDKWRLTAGASLFERIPMKKTPSLEINQNQCVCGNQGDECLYSNPVSRPNLFGGNDVTEYYIMLARRKMIAETEKLSQRQSFSENIPSWQNQEVRHPVQKPPGVFYNRSKRSARRGKKNRRLSRRKRRDANGDNTNKRVKRQAFGQYVGNQQPYYHPYYQPSYQPTQNYRQPGAYQSIGNGYQNQWPIAGATNPPAYDSPGGHKSQTKNQNRYSSNSFVPKSATSSQTFGQQPGISVGGYSAEQNPDYGSYAPNFYDPYPNYGQQFNSYNYESNYNQYQNPKYQNFNQKIPELQNQGYGQYSNVGSSYETPYSFSNSQQNQFAPPTKEVATPVRESNTGIPAVSRFSEKEYNYNQHNIYPTQRSRSAQSNNLHDSRYNHQSQSMSNDDVSGVTSRRHPRHERMRESSEVGGMNLHRELSDEPRTFGNTNNYGNVPDMISIYSEQDSRVQDSEYKIHPSYVFTEDLFPKTSLKTAMRWPNKRGWSKKFVTRKCSSTIRHLSIVTACEQTLGEESIQAAIDICVRDVHDKADWVWAERTYSMIENMCEEKLIKDTNLWRRKGDGSLSPPENIQSALRCPHNCYSNGRCRTNGCVCNTGYSGVDCSIKFTEKVVVTTTETTTTSSPTRPTTTSTTDVTTLMTSPRTILSSTTKNYPFVTKRKNHLRGQTDDNSNMTTQSKPTRQATAIKLVRKGRQPEEAIPTMPYRGQAVTLTHAANSGECRLSVSVCDRIELFGTGFNRKNPDSDLRCLVTKVEDGSQLPSLSFPAEIDPDDESHLYCPLPDTESLGMSPPPEVKYLIKLVDGDQESNSLEVVVFMDYGLQNPCIEINEPPHLVKANETLKAFEGEMFVYQLAAEDPFVFFELDDSTPNAYLTLNGLLEWSVPVADPIKEKNISFIIQDQCGLTTKETVQSSRMNRVVVEITIIFTIFILIINISSAKDIEHSYKHRREIRSSNTAKNIWRREVRNRIRRSFFDERRTWQPFGSRDDKIINTNTRHQLRHVVPTLTPEEIDVMVRTHNGLRKRVSPSASNMRRMHWNERLARVASKYAANCIYAHSDNAKVGNKEFGTQLGENIYIISGGKMNLIHAIRQWYDEVKEYDYNTGHCSGMCGHYTQVVWANSNEIGCAYVYCKGQVKVRYSYWKDPHMLVCNYIPAGNVRRGFLYGGRIAKPYKHGPPCTQCANRNDVCYDGLCDDAGSETDVDKHEKTTSPPRKSVLQDIDHKPNIHGSILTHGQGLDSNQRDNFPIEDFGHRHPSLGLIPNLKIRNQITVNRVVIPEIRQPENVARNPDIGGSNPTLTIGGNVNQEFTQWIEVDAQRISKIVGSIPTPTTERSQIVINLEPNVHKWIEVDAGRVVTRTGSNPTLPSITPAISSTTHASSSITPASSTFTPASSTIAPVSSTITTSSSNIPPASSTITPAGSNIPSASPTITPASSTITPTSSTITPASSTITPTSSTITPASSNITTANSDITPATSDETQVDPSDTLPKIKITAHGFQIEGNWRNRTQNKGKTIFSDEIFIKIHNSRKNFLKKFRKFHKRYFDIDAFLYQLELDDSFRKLIFYDEDFRNFTKGTTDTEQLPDETETGLPDSNIPMVEIFEKAAQRISKPNKTIFDFTFDVRLEKKEVIEIVTMHDAFRADIYPSATNMKRLHWSQEIAHDANEYIRKCINVAHKHPTDNIKISPDDVIMRDAIEEWSDEQYNYDWETGKCLFGKCEHYFKLAQDAFDRVGCAKTKCNGSVEVDGTILHNPYVFMCRYGSTIRPMEEIITILTSNAAKPYKAGKPCGSCARGEICVDNMCDTPQPVTSTPQTEVTSQTNDVITTARKVDPSGLISILPCLCENGGLCLPDLEKESGLGAYECRCPIGFDGKFCNETDGACLPGLTGSDCSQDIDECLQSPCYEGVECFNVIGSFVCGACPDGYIGNGFACAKADRVQGDGVSDVSNLEDENFVSSVEDIHALAHDVQASRELARDLAYDEDNLEYGESYQVDHENNDEIVVPKLESIISKDDKINHENSESHDKVNGAENHESGNITENRGQIEIAKVEVSNLGRGVDQANINDTTHKIPADDVSDINGHDNNHSVNHEVNHEVHEEKVKLNGIESLPPEYENTNSKLEENSDSKMAEVGDPITHEEIYEYGEIEEAPPVEARDPIRSESKVGGVQELPPPEFRDLNNENIVDSNTPGYVTNNEENISSNTSLELVENVDESEEITEFPPPAFRNLVNDNDALLNVTEAPKSHKTIIKSDVILERDPPEYLTKKEINDISFPDVIEVSSNDKGSNGSDSELPPPEVQNSGTNTNSPVPTNTITVPTPITILASTDSDSETKNNVDLVNINRTNQLVVPEIAPILPIAFETDPVTTSTNTKHRTDTSIVTTSDKILSTPRQSTTSRAKTSTPRTESSTSTTPEKKPSASISHSAESGSPTTHRTDSTIPTTTTNKPSTSTIITRSSIPTSPKTDTTTVEKKSPTPRADTSIPTTPITESSTPTSPRTDSTTSPTTPTKKPITPTIPIAKTSILTTHKTESSTPREAITTTTANNTIEPSTTTTTDTMLASSTTKGSTANELENSKSKLWNDFKNLRTRIQSRKSSVAISKPNTTSITRLTELVKLISTRIPSTLPRPEKKLLDATSNATRQTKINVTVPSLLSSNKNSTSISMHRPANTATRSKPESGTTNQPTSARTPTPGTTSLPTTKSTATSSVSNMKPTAIVNFTTIHMKPTDSPKPVPSETKLPVIVPDLVKIDSKTDVNNITSAHPADDTVEHVTVPTTSSTTKSVPTASKTTTSVPATSKTTTFAPETSTATTSVPTTSKTTKFPPITSATTTLVPTTGTTTLPVSTTSTNTTSLSTTIDASTSAPTTRMTTTSAQTTSKTTTSTPTTRPTSVPTTNETTTLVETTSPTTTIYASTTTAFVPTTSTNTTSPTTRTVSTSAPTTKTTTTSLPTTSKTTISESTTETTTTYLPTTTSTIGIATTSVPTTSKTTKPIPTTRPKTTSVPTTKQTTAFVPTNRTTTTSAPTTRPTSAFVPTINTTETSIPTTTTSTTTLPTTESITYTAITDSTTSILTTTTKKAVLTKMRRMMKCRKTKAGKVCVPVFRRMKYKPKLKHHLMIGGRPFEYYISRRYGRTQKYSQKDCQKRCGNKGTCNTNGMCKCKPQYAGQFCERSACDTLCENNGTCISRNTCKCVGGYFGGLCEKFKCENPCQNGGNCVGPNTCDCIKGCTGESCEIPVCEPECGNGGKCETGNKCSCLSGYVGDRCQKATCTPKCQNGGSCISKDVCACSRLHLGNRCQISVCAPRCGHGGRCLKDNKCLCKSGWNGNHCTSPVCIEKCANGGVCVSPNKCKCKSGWSGSTCKTGHCRRCRFGARCVRPNVCKCPFGPRGRICLLRTRHSLRSSASFGRF